MTIKLTTPQKNLIKKLAANGESKINPTSARALWITVKSLAECGLVSVSELGRTWRAYRLTEAGQAMAVELVAKARKPKPAPVVVESVVSMRILNNLWPASDIVGKNADIQRAEWQAAQTTPEPTPAKAIVYRNIAGHIQPHSIDRAKCQHKRVSGRFLMDSGSMATPMGYCDECGACVEWPVTATPASTVSPIEAPAAERVIAVPTSPDVLIACKRVSEASTAYWNHYHQMETKRGNGRYYKNVALLIADSETLHNLAQQLGQAATTYAQIASLEGVKGE